MAAHTTQQAVQDYDDERGAGWITFAGTLMLLVGTVNFIQGIAAVSDSSFYVHDTRYVIGSLNTWGWVMLCAGLVQCLVAWGVFVKNQFARWTGVVVLGANAIAQLLMMPAYPFWALTIFTVDLFAMYGLIAYGKRISSNA